MVFSDSTKSNQREIKNRYFIIFLFLGLALAVLILVKEFLSVELWGGNLKTSLGSEVNSNVSSNDASIENSVIVLDSPKVKPLTREDIVSLAKMSRLAKRVDPYDLAVPVNQDKYGYYAINSSHAHKVSVSQLKEAPLHISYFGVEPGDNIPVIEVIGADSSLLSIKNDVADRLVVDLRNMDLQQGKYIIRAGYEPIKKLLPRQYLLKVE